jgi:teichoic acid transport system permease protein
MISHTHTTDSELTKLGVRPPLLAYLGQVWRRRDFARAIAEGEIRSQNMDTVLGNLWHVLNPLLLAGIYILIFGVLLNVTRGVENFPVFIVVGVFTYHYTQKSVISGAKAIISNEGLIRSIRFPRAILPIATVLGQGFAFVPSILVMLAIALVLGEVPNVAWLLLPLIFLAQTLFNIGAAFIVARLTDLFRDLQNVLPYAFRLMFYVSGVIWSVDRFIQEGPIRELFDYNPFYVWITLARGPIMAEKTLIDPKLALIGAGWSVLLLVVGVVFFRQGEDRYGRA